MFTATLLLAALAACSDPAPAARPDATASDTRVQADDAPPADAPLAPWRTHLLDVAFRASCKFPLDPHGKNRARDQALVFDACLELDQPARALDHLPEIENWRRGLGHASYASWCAERGYDEAAREHLAEALVIARWPEDVIGQQWRRDRIRARMGATWLLLGDEQEAGAVTVNLQASEIGALQTTRTILSGERDFEAILWAVDQSLLAAEFDVVRGALDACILLHERHYDDAERRARIEARVLDNRTRMPRQLGIDVTLRLAATAVALGDRANGLRLVDDARVLIDGGQWNPGDHIPLMARQAALRHASGQEQRALDEADAALGLFEAQRERIVDIDRADALVPLAEAFHAMGLDDRAGEIYALALTEAVVNPNSRPRCDDLVQVCLSMAREAFEPGEALTRQIDAVHDGLGDPW